MTTSKIVGQHDRFSGFHTEKIQAVPLFSLIFYDKHYEKNSI